MKKQAILFIAAMAMISCGNTYEAKTVVLANQNDSMNYALGLVNGAQMKMYQLRNDSSKETVVEFIDALQRGYAEELKEESEPVMYGRNIGHAIKLAEENGLADNKAWKVNEKLFFQGMVNGMYHDTTVMKDTEAREYFQAKYQESNASGEKAPDQAPKAVKAKCPTKVKAVVLKDENDSLNYAFGMLNGSELAMYILSADTTGQMAKDFIEAVNQGLKDGYKNPQLVKMGEQIGHTIKAQEADGLIGEPSLATDFELIKQGFINGLLQDTVKMKWDATLAGQYVQETLNHIKYGNVKEEGEQFLQENALKDGVITTESGLQYEVIKMGKGKKPQATDKVKVHYHGTLIDGTVFDSSVERGEPITFGLNQVIAGWTEGVQLMPVGSKFKFYIPQELGYGSRQSGKIPPYSTLIFEVELLGIEK